MKPQYCNHIKYKKLWQEADGEDPAKNAITPFPVVVSDCKTPIRGGKRLPFPISSLKSKTNGKSKFHELDLSEKTY